MQKCQQPDYFVKGPFRQIAVVVSERSGSRRRIGRFPLEQCAAHRLVALVDHAFLWSRLYNSFSRLYHPQTSKKDRLINGMYCLPCLSRL
jgi:hypothetical protein